MNIKSIDWFQSAQLLAIIVGVFLVAYELNQARQISQAQGGGEHWAMIAQQDSAAAGENAFEAISKACYGEPLTREEAFTVQLWFAGFRMRYQRLQYVRDTAYQGINSPGPRNAVTVILSMPIGRRWWEMNSAGRSPEMTAIGEELLESVPADGCELYMEALRAEAT